MKNKSLSNSKLPLRRKRGRPSRKKSMEQPLNRVIIHAAKKVCCDYGVHGLTVERILKEAGVSRPTFYNLFKNKGDVLDIISTEVNEDLISAVTNTLNRNEPVNDRFLSVVDAYLDWGFRHGPIVRSLYQAIADQSSIAGKNRLKTVKALSEIIQNAIVASGRPCQDPLLLDALITMVEHLGTPVFTNTPSPEDISRVRSVIISIVKKLIIY